MTAKVVGFGASPVVAAPQAAEPGESTVKVVPPFQVAHAGVVYGSGDTVTAPEDVAAKWLLCGWVEPV